MKRLKRDVMNTIANFEVDVSMTYKLKYNQALEKATNKVLALVWNAFGELI